MGIQIAVCEQESAQKKLQSEYDWLSSKQKIITNDPNTRSTEIIDCDKVLHDFEGRSGEWSHEEVLDWICYIENGNFNRFTLNGIRNTEITGDSLEDLKNEFALKSWGLPE